ncbi:MAG TPA: serine/threonine-protein kinase [Gemmatimonadales bacterium]|nr:serine/threonine-protein kinase [Gemmatimonadales bacterium]
MPTLAERLQAVLAPRYTIATEIAAGGMGVVFLAHDGLLGRRVAVKVLAPELATAAAIARFRREARILARLAHPNIVPIHDAHAGDGLFYFIMDYVDGETLAKRLAAGPLAPSEATAIGIQLLDALALAHDAGVVHRDVKPANIFLHNGRALLADFGIAQSADGGETARTRTGERPGTPDYMAPEQVTGGAITPRTDIYSLGAVLYEAATGRRWEFATRPARAQWSGVPPRLARALKGALEPVPADRWPDAAAFRAALRPARQPGRWAYGVAAVVILAVAWWAAPVLLNDHDAEASVHRTRHQDLVLLPFTEGDSAQLGRRLTRYTGLRLGWYPRWTVASPDEPTAADDAEPDTIQFEAHGALARRGSGLTLVLSVNSHGKLFDSFEVPGTPDSILEWSRAIADSTVRHLFPAEAGEFIDLAARSAGNLQAYRELLEGDDAFQLDNMREAERRYVRALRLDPDFAQAAWKLMLVHRWERSDAGPGLWQFYREHGRDLPALYRSLTAAQLEPDLRTRQARLAELADSFPRRGVARFIQSDEMFHRGPLVGIPLRDAVESLMSGAAEDPYLDQASTYDHAAWGYIRLGDEAGTRRALAERGRRTARRSSREGDLRAAFMRLASDARFHPWRASIKKWWLARTADSATVQALSDYLRLGLSFDIPEMQIGLSEVLLERATSDSVRVQAQIAEALAMMMLGRVDEGLAEFDSAAALEPSEEMRLQQLEWRVMPELFGFPQRDSAERSAALNGLTAQANGGSLAPRAAWDLAMLAVARGDSSAVAHWDPIIHEALDDAGVARLDRLLHANETAARGHPDSALIISDPLFLTDSAGRLGGPFARSAFYLERGDWLLRMGRRGEAGKSWDWYENTDMSGWPHGPPQAGEVDGVLSTVARLKEAEIARANHQPVVACRYVDRVRELWAGADGPVRALLAQYPDSSCTR